jgi:receptor expression-enhancing protein 1/2/3/4
MYFITLSLFALVENTFDFILTWVPFYAWFRFFIHLYLILPGSQGATFLYQEYIDPFLYHHEREIDDLITNAHDRGKSLGIAYLEQAIEWAKVNVMGFAPKQKAPEPVQGQSYVQNFMSRVNIPAARGSSDLYGLVNQALSGAGALYGGNRDAQASDLSRNATLVPDNIRNNEDRLSSSLRSTDERWVDAVELAEGTAGRGPSGLWKTAGVISGEVYRVRFG